MKTEVSTAPRIYGLPKIHKENYPLRPICSSVNAPSSKLCKYISNILTRLTENSIYNVKNAREFKDRITNTTIESDEIMVSFDVVSLFPSVPVDLAVNIIQEKWDEIQEFTKIKKELFIKILRFCIQDSRYFQYKDKTYQQKKGLPMGSPASPIVADIVMEELLKKCVQNSDIRIKILTKYVDDLFGICKISHVENILTALNSFHPSIKFTMEKENNGRLPYLDTLIIRKANKIILDWYQKPTSSGRLVNFYSQHPKRVKINTAQNFIDRVINISHHSFHEKNYNKIRHILYQNSFPRKTIKKLMDKNKQNPQFEKTQSAIFKSLIYVPGLSERLEKANCIDNINHKIAHKPNNALQSLFTKLKSKTDKMEKSNLIYQIECKGNQTNPCGMYYIGTTKRKLKTRIAGHKSDLKKQMQQFAKNCTNLPLCERTTPS
ncbi:PREDICTED: uncharacterized protein LOC108362044 [Rhagoletis zephyria]|uniref:uncharacterized protein LOC108362044 n=1 Tax=Rhagoletis zephyria TaxID=28612 RepID=UPI00081128C3|nr:PREDICTED: uncharacterized protein LOC108362044 [Rhagoletis zephyria]